MKSKLSTKVSKTKRLDPEGGSGQRANQRRGGVQAVLLVFTLLPGWSRVAIVIAMAIVMLLSMIIPP